MRFHTVGLVAPLVFALLMAPLAAEAQSLTKVPRVGILSPQKSTEPPTVQREPFERGLRDLGWTPGVTILIEYRYAEGEVDRFPALATELVQLQVDVVSPGLTPGLSRAWKPERRRSGGCKASAAGQ